MEHKYSADRPITSFTDDLLGVADFAKSLASSIKGWKGNDSLVIALYGKWGSGKTSIKNLAIEALQQESGNSPNIVDFNPWQWAGQEQLAEAFFNEIGITLTKRSGDKTNKKSAAKWRSYAAYLKTGSFLANSIKKVLATSFIFIAAMGFGGFVIENPLLKNIFIIVSFLALILAAFFKWGGSLADNIASIFETKHDTNLKGLADLKRDLTDTLREIKQPLLIVMDDIDRLSSQEIKYLFQLVKANADFPNLVYLLLFQRDIVEKSLKEVAPVAGDKFLEKIVQVGFDIPKIEQSKLEKVLLKGLDDLISSKGVETRFDQHRWGNIYFGALRHFFGNLRNVNRFLATLSFHTALFKDRGSFNVNPIDLISLEVLRVFEPKIYQQLFDLKHFLAGQYDRGLGGERADEEARQAVNNLVELATENNRSQVREILKQLFPTIEWVLGGSHYSSEFSGEWYRDLRVCHEHVFDRYFHLSLPEGDISQFEIDEILALAGNREELVSKFRALNKRGLLGVSLNRLEAYKENIDLKYAVPFITAIMDIGDDIPDEPVGMFMFGLDVHATRIIHWYLKQEKDDKKRGKILLDSINSTTGLYIPLSKVSGEERTEKREKTKHTYLVNEEDFKKLKKICVSKINDAAKSGALQKHSKMQVILFRWQAWTAQEEPQTWVKQLVDSKDGLLQFLLAFVGESKSHGLGEYVYKTRRYIRITSIESFISSDVIAEKIKNIVIDELSEKEQEAVIAFKEAFKRKQEAKSDEDWSDEEY